MLRIGTLRWKGRCSRHPRYNPAYDGESGVVGACPRCLNLLDIYEQHSRLVRMMRDFGPVRSRIARQQDDVLSLRQRTLFE